MTLVVARIENGIFAVASDTQITDVGDQRLPEQQGVIKTSILPGPICVSFCNSAELAKKDFHRFLISYPEGAKYADTVSFFENSSASTGNDYLIALVNPIRMIRIVDGKLVKSVSKTAWIGDKAAYERFRQYEASAPVGSLKGRAMNAVLFADEMDKSPASDLYSAMRNVIADSSIKSTGGFVSVISSRINQFRYSVYSDMLYDWPTEEGEEYILKLDHPIRFGATEQNANYAVCQISTGYVNINMVAYYLVRGRKLFIYYGTDAVLADKCFVLSDVAPIQIEEKLRMVLQRDFHWLMLVTSAPETYSSSRRRDQPIENTSGIEMPFFVHSNTMPKVEKQK